MEKILCSAIWVKPEEKLTYVHQPKNITEGYVVCGMRHHNCFAIFSILAKQRIPVMEHVQGFLTSENRFVDRKEAWTIASEAKQITRQSLVNLFEKELYSENLY